MNELLTSALAAKYLGISEDALSAYNKQGLIASVRYPSLTSAGKPRRKRFYRLSTLDQFVIDCETKTGEESGHKAGHRNERPMRETTVNTGPTKGVQGIKDVADPQWMERYARK